MLAPAPKKPPFRIEGIDHIGLAPKDPNQAASFLGLILGLAETGDDEVPEQGVQTKMFASAASGEDGTRLEVLRAITSDGPIARYIDQRGGGIHHLAMRVDKLDAALAYLKEQGIALVDESPRRGAHGTRVAFVHPRATGGLLIELVEA